MKYKLTTAFAGIIRGMQKGKILTPTDEIYKPETIRTYKISLNNLKKFEKKNGIIYLDNVNKSLIDKIKIFLLNQSLAKNSISNILSNLKSIINRLYDSGKCKVSGSIIKVHREITTSVYNSQQELAVLANHKYASKGIAMVRDIFIIQSYLGLRIRDFKVLMKNLKLHIRSIGKSMYFEIKTSKTGEVVTIPVNRIVRKILKKRGLGFIIKFSYQYYNKTIKLLAKRAGIVQKIVVSKTIGGRRVDIIKAKYELMSSHTARRNFATNAYLAGVPVLAIMKITGHKTINSFMRYIRCASLESAINIAKHPFFK